MTAHMPQYLCRSSGSMMIDHPLSAIERAQLAADDEPLNRPRIPAELKPVATPQFIAAITSKWWRKEKTHFTTYFFGGTTAVKDRIIKFANVWGEVSAIKHSWTNDQNAADFRCAYTADGYYSYLGQDCRSIPVNRNTMNLQGMDSLSVPDAELMRVVPHEYGHAMGFPHEHSRQTIIDLLDVEKTVREMQRQTGWTRTQIMQQVFTVLSESAIFGTEPDVNSIMCYWFSGACTKSGQPIPGGNKLSPSDIAFAAKTWPKAGPVEPVGHKILIALAGAVTAAELVPAPVAGKTTLTISTHNDPGLVSMKMEAAPKPPNGGSGMLAKLLAILAAIRAGDWLKVLELLAELGKAQAAGQFSEEEYQAAAQAMGACDPK